MASEIEVSQIETLAERAAERAADRAAMRAVELTFLHLGVDVTNKAEMESFKERLDFLKRMDRGAREVKRAAIKTCVGALVTGLIALVLLGAQNYFKH